MSHIYTRNLSTYSQPHMKERSKHHKSWALISHAPQKMFDPVFRRAIFRMIQWLELFLRQAILCMQIVQNKEVIIDFHY